MKFKILGTEIYVSFLFTAVIAAMLAFDRTGLVLPVLTAIALHEAGHLFAMWITECAPKRIRLVPAAVEIVTKLPAGTKSEIIIALCGPAVNLLLFATLYFNFSVFKNELSLYYALINLLIGAFNLIPVSGLDGGTVLYAVLEKRLRPGRAALVMKILTLSAAAAVLFAAVCLTFRGSFNLSFYIVALYLIVMNVIKM